MVLGKGSLLSLTKKKEKEISVPLGIVVTECSFKDHLKGAHTESISILLLLSGNLKGHVSRVNYDVLLKVVVFCVKHKKVC